MIENFINSIEKVYMSESYLFKGDGTGDYEKIDSKIKSIQLLNDYREWLITQMEYVQLLMQLDVEGKAKEFELPDC